ncbi:sensor histidine kinase [Spirosoma areae]
MAKIYTGISPDTTQLLINKIRQKNQKIRWEKADGMVLELNGHQKVMIGTFVEGDDELLRAARIYERLTDYPLLIESLRLIAHTQVQTENGKLARATLQRAFELAQKHHDLMGLAACYRLYANMGIDHFLNYYREVSLLEKVSFDGRDERLANACSSLSIWYRRRNMPDSAAFYVRKCHQMADKTNYIYAKVGFYHSLSDYYLYYKKLYPEAIQAAKQGVYFSRKMKSPLRASIVTHNLYVAYKNMGNIPQSFTYLEEYHRLNDSLHMASTNERIASLKLKYDTERQQKQIDQLQINNQQQQLRQQQQLSYLLLAGFILLTAFAGFVLYNNRQLRQKNREISTALVQGQTLERQRVAADLHDNLGTTLSALCWNLEAMDKSKLTSTEQAVLATISQQVNQAYKDVRLLSHNLLPDELAKQGLAITLRNVVDKMNRNTLVHFRLTGVNELPRLNRQTEFELYSICLELINNILKHAQASEAFIDLVQANGTLTLTVSDNGMGVTDQRTEGRGLQNVAARVEALGGTWVVASGPGVQNRIVVPVRTPAHISSRT